MRISSVPGRCNATATKRETLANVRHRSGRYLNNRAENIHRPTRRRERQMQRFKSPEQAQRFLSSHAMIYGQSRPRQHLMFAAEYRLARNKAPPGLARGGLRPDGRVNPYAAVPLGLPRLLHGQLGNALAGYKTMAIIRKG